MRAARLFLVLTIPSTLRGTEWEKGEEVSVWLYRSTSKL